MKLYELPRNTFFTLNPYQEKGDNNAILSPEITNKEFKLDHIDGMYSYVTDKDNNVYHFAAWTEVTPLELPIFNPSTL